MSGLRGVVRDWTRDLLLNRLAASPLLPRPLRWRALAGLGLDVQQAAVAPGGHYGGRRISIGRGSFLNYGVFIDNTAHVTIGSRVQIGPEVMILTGSHHLGGPEARAGDSTGSPVRIGDGVWIGARALLLPGVDVGEGAVIAAGAVVVRSCEPNSLYAGVPARLVRALD